MRFEAPSIHGMCPACCSVTCGCKFKRRKRWLRFSGRGSEAWCDSLRRLRDDLSLRRSMEEMGRRRAEDLYSLRSALPTMVKTIKSVAAK